MSARKATRQAMDKAPSSGGRVVLLREDQSDPAPGGRPGLKPRATRGKPAFAGLGHAESKSASAAPLGPGAHFARLRRKLGEGRYEAEVATGEVLEVRPAPEVDVELCDLCLAEGETVLLGMLAGEAVVFGALRTRVKKAEVVEVEAPRKLVLRAGKAKLELSADGKVKLSGSEVTVDAPREVRLASRRVEVP